MLKYPVKTYLSIVVYLWLGVSAVSAQTIHRIAATGYRYRRSDYNMTPSEDLSPVSYTYTSFQSPGISQYRVQSTSYRWQNTGKVQFSPIDTLHMGALTRFFWGHHGFMRVTGLFPLHPGHPVEDLRQIAHTREKMMYWHQRLGLLTWASMAVTVYGGQRALNGHNPNLHLISLPITMGLYTATAVMAFASPPKLIDTSEGFDSIKLHRILAAVHIAGMLITPMLAPDEENLSPHGRARAHQISGYFTFGTYTAAMLVVALLK